MPTDRLHADSLQELSLAELMRLQNQLSQVLSERFERHLALAFSDIVGSTAYFARFGDEAGGKLRQRHVDLLHTVLSHYEGRLVDTAGDGAFACFPCVERAVDAVVALQHAVAKDNAIRTREHRLLVGVGIHYGRVLTDGAAVLGDAVNLCARVSETAGGAEIRLTRAAFVDLPPALRLNCQSLPPAVLKGIPHTVDLLVLDWRDRTLFPKSFQIEETGDEVRLPDQDVISFGRLKECDGVPANDIVLALPDRARMQRISRWQFELRRQPDGLFLRQVSDSTTEVDGNPVARGIQVQIRPGSRVRVAGVITLTFMAAPRASIVEEPTLAADWTAPDGQNV